MSKFAFIVSLGLGIALLPSCTNRERRAEVVKETYVHKYGVPVAKSDWEAQGHEGQIVQLQNDGVTVTSTYQKGTLEGPTTYSFPNSSTIQFVENYKEGILVSKRENYTSGVPMKEESYDGKLLVKLNRWYEDGTPQGEESYENGQIVSAEYRTLLNVVEARIQNGHGTRIRRSPEGELLSKDTFQSGQMVERITYFGNGDPATVTAFDQGAVHGTRMTFLQGGIPRSVEQWMKGAQEGITVLYQNGEKIAEVPYHKGKKNGVETRYRDGQILSEEISWKEDTLHGPRRFFVDGVPKSEWYLNGDLVSRSTFERMNLPTR